MFVDFRGIKDEYMQDKGLDYFENSRRATLANRAYAIANPSGFVGYGNNIWGLTASDGPANKLDTINGKEIHFKTYTALGAANALLARMYLYRSDFENAEKYALAVINSINSDEYDLEPVYTDANGQNGEHGVESVFEVGAVAVEGNGGGGNQYANTQGVRGTPNRGWGFNVQQFL